MSGFRPADLAEDYARRLLACLGVCADLPATRTPEPDFATWARCGAMHLTGSPDGPYPASSLSLALVI